MMMLPTYTNQTIPNQAQRPLEQLINAFARLPGVGPKTAQRYAFFVLKQPPEIAQLIASAITTAKTEVKSCRICHHWSHQDPCEICENPKRNALQLCVVESQQDVFALERTQTFTGKYHVLGGLIAPLDGVGPDQLNTRTLLERLPLNTADESLIIEVILALPPSTEGDTTSLYLSRILKPLGVKVSRIAYGLPVGGDLDYADQLTLTRALDGRTSF
ncbi:MAG: recombination mediator RecR [Candidatus Melainabacteria bacterium]|nr:recombination mediator RecR [Candidatus Melainabacteria bacterium]